MGLEEKIQELIDLDAGLQALRCNIEKEVKKLRSTVTWLLAISLPVLILLVGITAELRARNVSTEAKLTVINQNYAPFELVYGIIESNERLIDVLNAKDLKMHEEAMKAQRDYHRESLRRIQEQLNRTRNGNGEIGAN